MISKRLTKDVITLKKTLYSNKYLVSDLYMRKRERQGRILIGFLMFYRIIMALGTKNKTIEKNASK